MLGERPPAASLGAGERALDVAIAAVVLEHEVVADRFEDRGCVRCEGGIDIGQRGERLVLDIHQLGGVFGEIPARRDHEHHRIADEAHPISRERAERGRGEAGGTGRLHGSDDTLEVGGRDDQIDTGERERARPSTRVMVACANGLRTKAAWRRFGRVSSSTKWPWPRRSLGSSTRWTREPVSLTRQH